MPRHQQNATNSKVKPYLKTTLKPGFSKPLQKTAEIRNRYIINAR